MNGTADEAVAVLARERAAEFEHEIRDIVRDRFELARRPLRSSC